MLHEITLKNFKLFDEKGVTLSPGRITVFIGPNGTGKSSVLQALGIIKQSVVGSGGVLKLDGPAVFADYADLMHHGSPATMPSIDVTGPVGPHPPFMPVGGAFSYGFLFDSYGLFSQSFFMKADGDPVIAGEVTKTHEGTVHTTPSEFRIADDVAVRMAASMNFGRPLSLSAVFGQADALRAREAQLSASQWSDSIPRCLGSIYVVPALRGFERLAYPQLPNPGEEKDLAMLGSLEKRAEGAATMLLHDRSIEDKVAEWLERVTGRVASRKGAGQYQVVLETTSADEGRRTKKIKLVHDGFGSNQLVYVFTQMAAAGKSTTICIDEPEIHLHPAAQARLTDVLVDIAEVEDQQLILTTHSEHILMGLLTAVAKGSLASDDLRIYYFTREGDAAKMERLDVTENGQVKGGLKGFFEAGIDEMDRYMQAQFQKLAK
ncbi:MAG: AAA family ATPase [Chloroflexota bacterium]